MRPTVVTATPKRTEVSTITIRRPRIRVDASDDSPRIGGGSGVLDIGRAAGKRMMRAAQ
jgi:hypothetical protein